MVKQTKTQGRENVLILQTSAIKKIADIAK